MRTGSIRADLALVQAGLCESRAKAQEAILAGRVTADGMVVTKVSAPIAADAVLVSTLAHPWVSRGGVKLTAALDRFEFDPAGRICLDVGASTGGFSQVLLERDAAHVTAVDVGHGQLHASLVAHPRLTLIEGMDARHLDPGTLRAPPSLITIDVSFISLRLVLPHVLPLAAEGANLIALVKPQFEAGMRRVKKGVVRDPSVHDEVCRDIRAVVEGLGWRVVDVIPSPIEGGDGTRDFLLGARR